MTLTFDPPAMCSWCLTKQATTMLYTCPSCLQCAAGTAKDRVIAWQRAVYNRQQQGTGVK